MDAPRGPPRGSKAMDAAQVASSHQALTPSDWRYRTHRRGEVGSRPSSRLPDDWNPRWTTLRGSGAGPSRTMPHRGVRRATGGLDVRTRF